ncbi:flagellar biosynthetic protein FliR [Paracoccus ravus]|uniref:flagellar biosynthetic protein FliR n=1 Tax=Paracoccus ravus TaxID=2447760 RepID=UPI00106EABCE|nr:flagellar biosynthetic protein FliR [Paracoccus ravus]
MIELLQDPETEALLLKYILTFFRVQACIMALPAFSIPAVPQRVRLAVGISLTALFAEKSDLTLQTISIADILFLSVSETATGLLLGVVVRIFSISIDIASSVIAASTSLSQPMGFINEHAPNPVGNILHLAGAAVLMAIGMPVALCHLLNESYLLKPMGSWPDISHVLPFTIDVVLRCFSLAALLAAPYLIGGYLFQIISANISKVMPALPVMFVAAPAAILLSLAAFVILTPSTLSVWADAVLNFMADGVP